MKEIADLLPRVLENAPAAPEPTIIRHLRDSAIEFCRRTRVWRHQIIIPVMIAETEATLPIGGAQVFEISHAAFVVDPDDTEDRGTPLTPVTIDWLNREHPGWRLDEGAPRYLTQALPDTIMVTPKADGAVRLELILLPATDAEELPDLLVDSYGQHIADGAIGAVMLLPAEWANAEIGAFHAARFETHLGRFGATLPQGQQRTPRRTRPASNF